MNRIRSSFSCMLTFLGMLAFLLGPAALAQVDVTNLGNPIANIYPSWGSGNPSLAVIKDGVFPPVGSSNPDQMYDTWNGDLTRSFDWIGYVFEVSHTFEKVVFQEGINFSDGGWFTTLTVQVLVGNDWTDVQNLVVTPTYSGGNGVNYESFTLTFTPRAGVGIRIAGVPGGYYRFISVGELRAFESGGVTQYTLTANAIGSGSITKNPNKATYNSGESVQLTAVPSTGWQFAGWSGDLAGMTNPANIVMSANRTVTATFTEVPVMANTETFETFTATQTVGANANWYDGGTGPVVGSTNGVAGSKGLAASGTIFHWISRGFDWSDPTLAAVRFGMDFETGTNGQFDDDRIGWTTNSTSTLSDYQLGVQLDHPDGGIVTYWRNASGTRIQTVIAPLGTLPASTWYRLRATITRLTATSASIDVSLVQLDASGNPTGTPVTGRVNDTQTWPGGAPATSYFTPAQMWPTYKTHSSSPGDADNAYFEIIPVPPAKFAFVVMSDLHTSDLGVPNASVQSNLQHVKYLVDNPTTDMPAPSFLVLTGDFPHVDQTQAAITSVLGSGFLWYPVIGNHEVSDDLTRNFVNIRDAIVPSRPYVTNYGPTGSVNTSYSWTYGNAHFVATNAYWNGGTTAGSDYATDGNIVPQLLSWMDADVSADASDHTYVFVHEPAYPDDRHVGDALDKYPTNRDAFVSMLDNRGVETIFSGHTHYFDHVTSANYPLLGDVHSVTTAYSRVFPVGTSEGPNIVYVVIDGATATYRAYRGTGAPPFPMEQTWVITAGGPIQYSLNVSVTGSGSVVKSPDQLTYAPGDVVTLTATANAGWEFSGWSGSVTGTTNPTTVTMDGNKVVTATFTSTSTAGVLEPFETFGSGSLLDAHPDWYSASGGPTVSATGGVAGSKGLSNAQYTYTWIAHPFNWNAPNFAGVIMQGDFQTDASAHFDDDRLGWIIQANSTNSDHDFGVQMDPGGTGYNIECYWDGDAFGDDGGRASIVSLPTLAANSWYRFRVQFTKLGPTSTQVDVRLTALDAAGNPGAIIAEGSIPNTALLPNTAGNEIPNPGYFTPTSVWPAFKNYNAIAGGFDNAYYEVLTTTPGTYTLTVNVTGNGTVTKNPDNPTYASGQIVDLTAVPATGWQFAGWSGDLGGTTNPATVTMNANKTVTATFTEITPGLVFQEPFETGFLVGQDVGESPGWFDGTDADGPNVTAGVGVNGSTGLAPSNWAATWTAHPFTWTNPDLLGVIVGMDFQTNGSGAFDDDRVGWVIQNNTTNSNDHFGVQLDPGGTGQNIECYWDGATDNGGRTSIVSLPALSANAFYRLRATFTKITNGSARIDVMLTQLAADGTPGAVIATGNIPNTALLPNTPDNQIPLPGYFSAAQMWPLYKNYQGTTGAADNAYFEILTSGAETYTLTMNVTGSGTVAKDPDTPTYESGQVVNLTATPAAGWTFSGWSGDLTGSTNPTSITMNANKTVTATFTPIPKVLTVNIVGNGAVTRNPDKPTYNLNEEVQVTATADPGWTFSGWSGDLTGSTNPTSITMDGDKSITATFVIIPLGFMEPFEAASFGVGSLVGAHPDWYDGGNGPTIGSGVGIAGSKGLNSGNNIFTWEAHPFSWSAADLEKVIVQMDFKTDGSAHFDDDRIGWMTTIANVTSSNFFGVQLDPIDATPAVYNIEAYWRNAANNGDVRTTLATLTGMVANTWYRFKLEVTKLAAQDARLDVSLTLLDAVGNPTGTPITGAVPSTAALGTNAPWSSYFTTANLYPAFKNYTTAAAPADNAYFELVTTAPTTYTLAVNVVGSGTVTKNPNNASYASGQSVELTATPNAGWTFGGWSGDLTGTANPTSILMDANKTVTATFVEIPSVWNADITVSNSSLTRTLTFGQDNAATEGLDQALNEQELPPVPPAGTFDARFMLPTVPSVPSLKDFRPSARTQAQWALQFQPGPAGYPITFTWNNAALPAGNFFLRDAGSGSLVNVNMKTQGTYTLANPAITSLVVLYYRDVLTPECVDVAVQAGWNLLSVPLAAASMVKADVFPAATSVAFGFEDGYFEAALLENGKGYWLKFDAPGVTQVCGTEVGGTIELAQGWNIVGPFAANIEVAQITTTPVGILTSAFFGFDNAYSQAATLVPGRGYWVKASQPGTMTLPAGTGKVVFAEAWQDSTWPTIAVVDNRGRSRMLYLAMQLDSQRSYELPPAPPAGAFDIRFASNTFAELVSQAAHDILISGAQFPVTLEFANMGHMVLRLRDRSSGATLAERASDGATITLESPVARLGLDAVVAHGVPQDYALNQNYPNPFNPSTRISFTLPSNSTVKLTVYTVLGELVQELVRGEMEAGYHEVTFDASSLPSGIYLYRLETGSFTEARKMVFMK